MPILEITSANAPKDIRDFVKRVSALFAECIGKPESYCVVTFNKVDSLFYNGSDEPGFIAKVGSIGHISNERNANLTKVITEALEKELGTINDRGYFMFTDFPAENIGYKHTTFANILNQ
ncbi:Tautomerase/MIF superfamily [Pilaira anomala]|nr:Tautomerase/MIF superfamily [Pilaira anomala]